MKKMLFLTLIISLAVLGACSLKTPDVNPETVFNNQGEGEVNDSEQMIDDSDLINQDELVVGGDRDEFGCIPSAGYTWCETKNKCLRIWEENCFSDLKDEIQFMLAKKYNKNLYEVNVVIKKETENHAAGSVMFGTSNEPGEGGQFLTYKNKEVWTLVYDGNGSVDCENLKSTYNFPDEILQPEFCD